MVSLKAKLAVGERDSSAFLSRYLILFFSQLDGKLVEPKVAVPRKTNPKLVMRTRKIFVGGLSSSTRYGHHF